MQSIFEKLIDNLVIAALVPSLVFFTVLVLLFGDLVPVYIVEKLRIIFGNQAVMISALSISASFMLSYSSAIIYQFYDGRFLSKWEWLSKQLSYRERIQAKKLKIKIRKSNRKISKLLQTKKQNDPELVKMTTERDSSVREYQNIFPPINQILPTRFGNILSAAEYYPLSRFGIKNPDQIWLRLQQVIPSENMSKIDKVNHEMAFLVNSSFFSILLASISFVAALYRFMLGYFDSGWFYAIFGAGSFILGWFFYQLSLPLVLRWTEMYRCIFDLFRFQLCEQLHFNCPSDPASEHTHWAKVNEFMNATNVGPVKFLSYKHPGYPESQSEQEEFVSINNIPTE